MGKLQEEENTFWNLINKKLNIIHKYEKSTFLFTSPPGQVTTPNVWPTVAEQTNRHFSLLLGIEKQIGLQKQIYRTASQHFSSDTQKAITFKVLSSFM